MIILILAPHTDDGEFGCGGTISKFVRAGHDVYYVAFSAAEKSVPNGFPHDILRKEVVEATSVLGIDQSHLQILDFEVRNFPLHRQEILDVMVNLEKSVDPDMVLLPSTSDTHQDHQTISSEGFRIFKKTTMLGYEAPANNLTFETNVFIELSDSDLEAKTKSLLHYESQKFRGIFNSDYITCLARVRGGQIGVKYAETFEAIRWVIR